MVTPVRTHANASNEYSHIIFSYLPSLSTIFMIVPKAIDNYQNALIVPKFLVTKEGEEEDIRCFDDTFFMNDLNRRNKRAD